MTTYSFLVFFLFLFLEQATTETVESESKEAVKVPVNLKRLPELFSNAKLPANGERESCNNKCLHLLGCIQTLPELEPTQEMYNTTKMKSLFWIFNRQDDVLVAQEPVLNCLASNMDVCETFPYDMSLLSKTKFDPKLRTIIVINGYRSDEFDELDIGIKNTWLAWEDVNVILTSWSGGNQGLYGSAVANSKVMARQITVLLYYLATLRGFELNNERFTHQISFVGHSLGAHIGGFVGQDLNGRLGRITGLDPAGPMFINKQPPFRLDQSDAVLVDVLHTNGGKISIFNPKYYGLLTPVGHLDFYANDGQHQPNCFADHLGCSHKTAVDFYQSFLNHELFMRKHLESLDKEYHRCHRIFAYASDTYEEFFDGSAMIKRCPKTIMDESDLHSSDINNCLAPIDFVSPYDQLRDELTNQYHLEMGPNANFKFYFNTHKNNPYLNNHQLLRARVTKRKDQKPTECDLTLRIKMAGGAMLEKMVDRYSLLDAGDHYQIIVPFLSSNLMSKYELAELDAHDYFQDEPEKLKDKLVKVFPAQIWVEGLASGGVGGEEKKKGGGLFGMFKNLFGMASDKSNERPGSHRMCNLNIESLSVQPLKKIHRSLLAIYSIKAKDKSQPDLMFLFDEKSTLPKIPVAASMTPHASKQEFKSSEIYLDTIILSPHDAKTDTTEPPKVENEGELVSDGEALWEEPDKDEEVDVPTESSSFGGALWVSLMMVSLTIVVAFIILVFKWMAQTERAQEDLHRLVTND